MIATPTDSVSVDVYLQLAPDLSGKVSKAEDHYFDFGGSADIWRGTLELSIGDCEVVRGQL